MFPLFRILKILFLRLTCRAHFVRSRLVLSFFERILNKFQTFALFRKIQNIEWPTLSSILQDSALWNLTWHFLWRQVFPNLLIVTEKSLAPSKFEDIQFVASAFEFSKLKRGLRQIFSTDEQTLQLFWLEKSSQFVASRMCFVPRLPLNPSMNKKNFCFSRRGHLISSRVRYAS